MQIHICDTSLIPAHACCGGFLWPDEIQALCGRRVAFQPVRLEALGPDEEPFCPACLRILRTRSARHYESICTVAEGCPSRGIP